MDRRSFVTNIAYGSVMALMAGRSAVAFAQNRIVLPPPTEDSAYKVVSSAALRIWNTRSGSYDGAIRQHSISADGLGVLAQTHEDNWNYYTEICMDLQLTNDMQVNAGTLLLDPDSSTVSALQTRFATYGAVYSFDEMRDLLYITPESRQSALDFVASQGLSRVALQGVAILRMAKTGSTGTTPDQCRNYDRVVNTILLAAAMNGAAVFVGCVPCGGIAAGLGLFGAGLRFLKPMLNVNC